MRDHAIPLQTKTTAALPKRLSILEYTCLMAMMAALGALSIDTMLPGLALIGSELSPRTPERATLVIGAFFLGLGLGTFVTGPLSDAYGRKPVILGGIGVYCLGALLATLAQSLEMLLFARVVQGLGVAGPRVATMAITRDLFSGRQMARVVSLTMTIFAVVPAAAPYLGSILITQSGWRAIFLCFIGFAVIAGAWLWLRQPETLPAARRRAFAPSQLWGGVVGVLALRDVRRTILALSLTFSMLFVTLSSAHHVFEVHFHMGDQFPAWFAVIGLLAALASFCNARIVLRLGMRRLVMLSLGAQVLAASVVAQLVLLDLPGLFWVYVAWLVTVFMTTSFCIGNLNALGLEPLGHLAGIGSSIISGLSTLGAVGVSSLVSLLCAGGPLVPAVAIALCALGGLAALRRRGD